MIDRRSFLIATAATLAAGPVRAAGADPFIPLWPGEPPGGGGPSGPLEVSPRGGVSNVAVPGLERVAPARPNGAAVLVAAGGGYKRIEMEGEGRPAARWLADRGITAFLLQYRLPSEGWADGPLAPLQDAQRALRLIRAEARQGGLGRGLDPARIGVLGFSAGGHLMGMASARGAFASYAPRDAADMQSARVDAAALIYPVITLEPPYDNTSTRRSLVGDHPTSEASAHWSVQTYVRPGCASMFLVQAADDPISNAANTRIMDDACRHAGIPVELHRLPSGGHGFGMGRPDTPSAQWPHWYEAWLQARGFLG